MPPRLAGLRCLGKPPGSSGATDMPPSPGQTESVGLTARTSGLALVPGLTPNILPPGPVTGKPLASSCILRKSRMHPRAQVLRVNESFTLPTLSLYNWFLSAPQHSCHKRNSFARMRLGCLFQLHQSSILTPFPFSVDIDTRCLFRPLPMNLLLHVPVKEM